ncbi:MAG: VTT domain-containing protein [Halobacteria archaeon]|nr:VTT domain-containing protein [Halobacteria archaeon]
MLPLPETGALVFQVLYILSESSLSPTFVERVVETATGWFGVGVVFVYSFLIAFVLPLPSEVVLAAPIDLGLGPTGNLIVILVTSGTGKAFGSVVALHLGLEARSSGPVTRFLRRSRFDVLEWSEKKSVKLAREFGYVGLAIGLSVPFFPDTASIYAFAMLEDNYLKFAGAAFFGSVMRLLITIGFFESVM